MPHRFTTPYEVALKYKALKKTLEKEEDIQSRTIRFLRFPLIVAVVLIHTRLDHVVVNGHLLTETARFPVFALCQHIVSTEIARIAVPLFYFMSGYLFFYRSTPFSLAVYGQRIKKRVHSLLVPYLFWNAAVFLLLFLAQQCMPELTSGQNKAVTDYHWTDWLNLFWSHRDGRPVCYQFWFIRDLFVVMLLSPLLHLLLRRLRWTVVGLFGLLWVFNGWYAVPGLSITAFFFFSWGACYSIEGIPFTPGFRRHRRLLLLTYLTMLALNTLLWKAQQTDWFFLQNVGVTLGVAATMGWTAHALSRHTLRVNPFLASASFFVFAYHGMPMTLAIKCWVRLWSPLGEAQLLAGYVLIPLLIVALGLGLYAVLRKHFPAFTACITGGR